MVTGFTVKLVYFLKAKKQGKLFWIFKVTMDVETEIDAVTGEVINTKKPWWAFLVDE